MSILKNTKIALPVAVDYILWPEMSSFNSMGPDLQILLAAGAAWKNIYVTPGSIVFEESTPDSSDDFIYNSSLVMEIPSSNKEITSKLDDLFRSELILRVKFTDDSYRILASPLFSMPSRLKLAQVKSASRDSTKVTCSLNLPHPCPFYISS